MTIRNRALTCGHERQFPAQEPLHTGGLVHKYNNARHQTNNHPPKEPLHVITSFPQKSPVPWRYLHSTNSTLLTFPSNIHDTQGIPNT